MPEITYMGTKRRIVSRIADLLREEGFRGEHKNPPRILDLFSGSGSVAADFRKRGWRATAVDSLPWLYPYLVAQLELDREPEFADLLPRLQNNFLLHLPAERVCWHLNHMPVPEDRLGFISQNYTPLYRGVNRRQHFSEPNGRRIDAVRAQIEEWYNRGKGCLSREEYYYLLASLLFAAHTAANCPGRLDVYRKKRDHRYRNPLRLQPFALTEGPVGRACTAEAGQWLSKYPHSLGVVYMDPPYTSLEYAKIYHLLNTIYLDDSPALLWRGHRVDQANYKNGFYSRKQAAAALREVINAVRYRAEAIVLSYSEEGLLKIDELCEIMDLRCPPRVVQMRGHPRHLAQAYANPKWHLTEYLIFADLRR